jgi:hypothetical protein
MSRCPCGRCKDNDWVRIGMKMCPKSEVTYERREKDMLFNSAGN